LGDTAAFGAAAAAYLIVEQPAIGAGKALIGKLVGARPAAPPSRRPNDPPAEFITFPSGEAQTVSPGPPELSRQGDSARKSAALGAMKISVFAAVPIEIALGEFAL
jgi:hypothetical protein